MGFNFTVKFYDQGYKPVADAGPYQQRLTDAATAAMSQYAQYISGSASIEIGIRVVYRSDSTNYGNVAMGAGTARIISNNIQSDFSSPAFVLIHGSIPAEYMGSPGFMVHVDARLLEKLAFVGPNDSVPAGQYDASSIFLGPISNAFGFFTDYYVQDGQLKQAHNPYGQLMTGPMDPYLQVINNAYYFTGPNAQAVYGGPVPIGRTDQFGNVNLDSLAIDDAFNIGDPHQIAGIQPGKHYGLSRLDLAILKDLNPQLQVTIPQALQKGTDGNDVFHAVRGMANNFDGLGGRDTVIEQGRWQDAKIVQSGNQVTIAANGTVDTFFNVERIKFDDGVLILDGGPNGAIAYRMYQAAFARIPDEPGLLVQAHNGLDVYVALKVAAGASTAAPYSPTISISEAHYLADMQLAQNFINSAEFQARYGANPSDRDFVTLLYQNVLNRIPDEGGYTVQVGALQAGMSRAQLLTNFAESVENLALTGQNTAHGLWSIYPDSAFA